MGIRFRSLLALFSPLPRPLFFSITALGFSATATQIVLLREFLAVFFGNELVIGIILANWFLLTGIGTIFGKKAERIRSPLDFLCVAQLVIAVLPLLSLVAIRVAKGQWFPPGEMVGVVEVFCFSGLILLPYCLISGFIHPFACVFFSKISEKNRIGEVYFLDVLGDILGGLVFSGIFVFFFNSVGIAFILFGLNTLAAAFLLFQKDYPVIRRKAILPVMIVIVLAGGQIFGFHDINRWTLDRMFPKQEVLESAETPHGFLVATRTGKQVNFFENGLPVYSSEMTVQAEESVHYGMLQHPAPKKILLVSGGTRSVFKEIDKYPGVEVDYLELNPTVVEFNKKYGGLSEKAHIQVLHQDGRRYIKRTSNRYDVILLCLPEPHSTALNRYYTREFYQESSGILNEEGILAFGLVPMSNYFSGETRKLLSSQYQTLQKVFPHVTFIPGSRVFFVAGKGQVTSDIVGLLEKRVDFKANFLTTGVLQGYLTPDRVGMVREAVLEDASGNRDQSPVSCLYQLLIWVKLFKEKTIWLVIGLGVLGIWFVSRLETATFVMFSSGFSGSCLSVVLILVFQAMQGYIYFMMGFLIAVFLSGMAIGTFLGNGYTVNSKAIVLKRIEAGLLFLSLAMPTILSQVSCFRNSWFYEVLTPAIISILLLLLGSLVGMEFSVISRMIKGKISRAAGMVYSADYFGAALGAILSSVVLIPLLGLYQVSYGVAFLHLLSLVLLYKGDKKIPLYETGALLLYIGLFGWLVLEEGTAEKTYVLSYHPVYLWFIVLATLLTSGFLLLRPHNIRELVGKWNLRLFSVIGFIPLIFFPVFKCWFIVPWLYCHVCPRKCIFGFVRPFTITMISLQNLHHRFWCAYLCPIGILQDTQCAKGRSLPARIKNPVRFWIFGLFVLSYLWIEQARRHPEIGPGTDLFLFMFTNDYAFSVSIFSGILILFLISFFYKRFFCDLLCPVGTFAVLITRLDQNLVRKYPWWKGTVRGEMGKSQEEKAN